MIKHKREGRGKKGKEVWREEKKERQGEREGRDRDERMRKSTRVYDIDRKIYKVLEGFTTYGTRDPI